MKLLAVFPVPRRLRPPQESVGRTFRFSKPERFDIAGRLKPGKNVIEIRVYNLDQGAGLCADVYIRTAKEDLYFFTDRSWMCRITGKKPDRPENYNTPVLELGAPLILPPWNARIQHVYAGPRGILIPERSENGRIVASVKTPCVKNSWSIKFNRIGKSGKKDSFLLPTEFSRDENGKLTITFPKIRPAKEASTVYIDDEYWEMAGNAPVCQLPAAGNSTPGLKTAKFIGVGKRTKIEFDGKLYDPTFYMSDEFERFGPIIRAGMKNFIVQAPLVNFWKGVDDYDFSTIDRNMETLLTINPEAIFMLDIRFYMPEWWLEMYPDNTSAYFEKSARNKFDDVQALASKEWLKAAERPLQALMSHIKQSYYADRIWGVNIGDSRGNEWFWGGATAGRDLYGKKAHPGFSPADYRTFRAMLKQWYGTDAALQKAWEMPHVTIVDAPMPDPTRRFKGSVGVLFDPEKDRQIMDWCRFRNESLAAAIVHFAERLKALSNRKWLVGAYYGYLTQLSGAQGAVS